MAPTKELGWAPNFGSSRWLAGWLAGLLASSLARSLAACSQSTLALASTQALAQSMRAQTKTLSQFILLRFGRPPAASVWQARGADLRARCPTRAHSCAPPPPLPVAAAARALAAGRGGPRSWLATDWPAHHNGRPSSGIPCVCARLAHKAGWLAGRPAVHNYCSRRQIFRKLELRRNSER